MSLQTLFEKLQLKDEKNILIQGLPSSIEKQFLKITFSKSVTPLLRSRRIEFALVFAVNKKQLTDILDDVLPALGEDANFWIAYPKVTSKIASDLTRDCNWQCLENYGLDAIRQIALDNVWTAMRFKKKEMTRPVPVKPIEDTSNAHSGKRNVTIPEELKVLFSKNKPASIFFDSLSFTNKKEYVEWIAAAKKEETKSRRLDALVTKLNTGKKNPTAK